MASPNPYEPPASRYVAPTFDKPLPGGVRRIKLDPGRLRGLLRRNAVRSILPTALVATGGVASFRLIGSAIDSASPPGSAVSIAFGMVLYVLFLVSQTRAPRDQLATYELLLGPRVLRRTLAKMPPAEVLRPEVTAIYESWIGLWVMCASPGRSLFVIAGVEGFADVRAELATWHPIEAVKGWAAWRVGRAGAKQQGERLETADGERAIEPTLAVELASVRAASSDAWRAFPVQNQRTRSQLLFLCGLLIVVLVVVLFVVKTVFEP